MKIATLAFIMRGNEVLLGFRKGDSEVGKGKLNAPGGKVEAGETPDECIVREVREEIGATLDSARLEKVAVVTFYNSGIPDYEVHVYRTDMFTGEPRETEAMTPEWYDIRDIPFDNMHDADEKWMPQAIRGRKFRANVFYEKRGEGFQNIEFLPFSP